MSGRLSQRVHAVGARFKGRTPTLTAEQVAARERWQRIWNLPILIAAILPLLATSPSSRVVEIVIGVGSWLVFVIDLHVQRRIVPDYVRSPNGRVDVAIVLLTFPFYLIPGLSGYTAIFQIARLARVARLLVATSGLRRFVARLGKVAVVAGLMVLVGSLVAYGAEHPDNPGYATVGDALWWGIVTLTTVGYGDIVPKTPTGRIAGIGIMFTGVATIGILAGSLAQLFGVDQTKEATSGSTTTPDDPKAKLGELRSLLDQQERSTADLKARLGEIEALL